MASPSAAMPWFFPTADAVVTEKLPRQGKLPVRVLHYEGNFSNRILIAGCDPGISVLSRYVQAAGIELVLTHRNSSQALSLLHDGCVHVAGTHLRDDATGESNLPEVARLFPPDSAVVISFANWEEGILTARGNPRGIRAVEDFADKNVTIVNREKGAGARALLDSRLDQLGITPRRIRGYSNTAPGHLAAAMQVQSGAADCCIATQAAARLLGLHFIPLATERYDFVLRKEHFELPRIQNMLDILGRADFRNELEGLGGYDTKVMGQRVM